MPSLPSTRPSDARGRRSFSFVRERHATANTYETVSEPVEIRIRMQEFAEVVSRKLCTGSADAAAYGSRFSISGVPCEPSRAWRRHRLLVQETPCGQGGYVEVVSLRESFVEGRREKG